MSTLFDFSYFPIITTQRLTLREMTTRDISALFKLFSNDAVTRYNDVDTFKHMNEAESLLGFLQERFDHRIGLRWGICLKSHDEMFLGTCGYNAWSRHNACGKIGYDLMPAYWGKGIMTEAVHGIVQFGFRYMQLNRIEADVTLNNHASVRVLEKVGFKAEGILRQAGYWKGRYHDLRLFALLREEYGY